jgi:hypothetical protein
MFNTKEDFKSPLSALMAVDGYTSWRAAELALDVPWFMVVFLQPVPTGHDEPLIRSRTMMFAHIEDVENLIGMHAKGQVEIVSVLVVTPRHINGSQSWKMEPLKAVWMAEERSVPGHTAEIYETDEGVEYSRYFTPREKLGNRILRFRWNG